MDSLAGSCSLSTNSRIKVRLLVSQDDLAADMALYGTREDTVDSNAQGAVREQGCNLGQLRAVRANLRRRDGYAQLTGIRRAIEPQRKDRKQRTAAPERWQEAYCRTRRRACVSADAAAGIRGVCAAARSGGVKDVSGLLRQPSLPPR